MVSMNTYVKKKELQIVLLTSPFYRKKGKITTQIHLACALQYFAGGSYIDIIMSHAIGKTDFYRSIWAMVHATNK